MLRELIFVIEEDPEGGYNAEALGVSIITQGDSVEELKKNILDAIKCHFENEEEIPKIIKLHYIKEEFLKYA
jgi:predicted RNase H-like HicB family nuclease